MMSEKKKTPMILTPNSAPSSLCGPQHKHVRLSFMEEVLDYGLLLTAT